MEVHFTPEQEAQLSQIAANAGTDAGSVSVKDAALRLLQGDSGFHAVLSGKRGCCNARALRARVKPGSRRLDNARLRSLRTPLKMALVVDASIVSLHGHCPDESSTYADSVLAVVERDGLRVPELWAREIANGLAVAYLRKRIESADERAFLAALSHLSIDVEGATSAVTAIRDGTAAAMRYGLTAYDAAYVDLASRAIRN